MKDKKIDVKKVNEVLTLSSEILKVGFIIAVILLIVLVTNLFIAWDLLTFIKNIFIVLSPLFLGVLIAWLFDPMVRYLQDKKVPRLVGCIIVYLFIFGGLGLLCFLLMPSFIDQIKEFIVEIPRIMNDVKGFVSDIFKSLTDSTSLNLSSTKQEILESMETFAGNITRNLPNTLLDMTTSFVSGSISFILGIMIGFYLLYDFDKLHPIVIKTLPKAWEKNTKDLIKRINKSLRGYVQGVLIVMLLVFLTQSVGLTLAGLKAPLIFAFFCAVTDIIPYFGPYIGGAPAVIVGFTISPMTGICALISIIVVQILENNFYQPIIMGHAMKLHPVTIMIGLLIFQHFFGIVGMIVATPVIASVKVILLFVDEKLNVMKKIKDN